MENKHKPYGLYEKYIKRPQDFLLSLFAFVVLSPVTVSYTHLDVYKRQPERRGCSRKGIR